jgi:anti-sigma B factor antagonist
MNHYPGVIVSRLEGRLGIDELDAFQESIQKLLRGGHSQIVVDLNAVDYLDSNGIDVLLHCLAQAVRADGELKLAALSPASETILAITRASRFFEIFPTVEGAVASFDFLPIANGAEPWNALVSVEKSDASEFGMSQA